MMFSFVVRTAEWRRYERKAIPAAGGAEEYVTEKLIKTERPRAARAGGRAERKRNRASDVLQEE